MPSDRPADRAYRIATGGGETLEWVEGDEEAATDARVRWMDAAPEVVVEVYERAE